MELRKLEYLLKVAETRSITEAAKQLYITQPALSQVITTLEKNYNTQLFERKNGGLELTRSGWIMVEAARKQLLVEANMVRELEDAKIGNAGTLRVGMSVNRVLLCLPSLLPAFKEHFSRIDVKVDTHSYLGFEKMVAEGKLDMAFVMKEADVPGKIRSKLHYEPLFSYNVLLAVPPQHPLTQETGGIYDWRLRPAVSLDRVRQDPFIVAPAKVRQDSWLSRIYNAYEFVPNVVLTVNGACQYAMVQAGLGCAILQDTVAFAMKRGTFFRLDKGDFATTLCLVYRKDTYLNESMKYFIDLIKNNNKAGIWKRLT